MKINSPQLLIFNYHKKNKRNRNNKANWSLLFEKISIKFIAWKIWKKQKDMRLNAKKYLSILNEKYFTNDDEIKEKVFKNKKYYFDKLIKFTLKINNRITKNNELLKTLKLELNNQKTNENIETLIQKNEQLIALRKNKTKDILFAYYEMNYLIQHKPYFINREIDKTIINMKNKKIAYCETKINHLETIIKQLYSKLNNFKTSDKSIDLNKPTKTVFNLINSINIYESKKQKVINLKLDIIHRFDLIKHQWKRNNFHELIVNPYYKTHA